MEQFRTKPQVVEAAQWTGSKYQIPSLREWGCMGIGNIRPDNSISFEFTRRSGFAVLTSVAEPTDWIVRDSEGGFSVVTNREFSESYQKEVELERIKTIIGHDGDDVADQVEKEWSDYAMIIGHCSEIYEHVTGGQVSKANTLPSVVCAIADDVFTTRVDDALAEAGVPDAVVALFRIIRFASQASTHEFMHMLASLKNASGEPLLESSDLGAIQGELWPHFANPNHPGHTMADGKPDPLDPFVV